MLSLVNLEHLNLSNNKFMQRGFTEMCRLVRKIHKLKSLDMSYNQLDKDYF